MNPGRWFWIVALLLALAVAAGCGAPATAPDVAFTTVELNEAPAQLAEQYAQMRTLPGLVVLQSGGETYLLLMAGTEPEPATVVQVLNIRKMGKEWRVMAVMLPGQSTGMSYPFTIVKTKAPPNTPFMARLTRPDGNAVELVGMPVTDR